mgnify:FL=1
MKTKKQQTKELNITFMIISTWLVVLTLCFIGMFIHQEKYQEECVQSHLVPDKIIDYTNYTYAGYTHHIDGRDVPFYRGEPTYNYTTVCDKYALVRYAEVD